MKMVSMANPARVTMMMARRMTMMMLAGTK
jgi:hypothetical protein